MATGGKTAAILAGGKSSRMGQDKALLKVGGTMMLERIARAANGAELKLLVIGREQAPADWPGDLEAIFLADRGAAFSGPMEGLAQALEMAAEPLVLLACDTPLVTAAGILQLLEAHAAAPEGTTATMAVRADEFGKLYAEPAFSVYTPAILPLLRGRLLRAQKSFQPLLRETGIHAWRVPEALAGELLNVNDAANLAAAEQVLRERNSS